MTADVARAVQPRALAPLPGDPVEVRALADVLARQGEGVAALGRTVGGLGDPGLVGWSSPAGSAFARRVGAVPAVLAAVANRYGVAASALRGLADGLAMAQAEVAWAQRVLAEEWGPFLAAGDRMALAEASPDPTERAAAVVHRAEMVAHGERVEEARRRHQLAWDAFEVADRRCATTLHALLDDGLADSAVYDALTGVSRAGGAVAAVAGTLSLAPPLKVLAPVASAAEGVRLAADGTVLAAYGDGDATDLLLRGGAALAGGAAPLLKSGARATNAEAVRAATTRAERRAAALTTRDRLAAGARSRLADLRGARGGALGGVGGGSSRAQTARATATTAPAVNRVRPRGMAQTRAWLAEQAQVRATAWARRRWLDDLDVVLRTDGSSLPMHVTSVAVERTGADLGRAASVREHVTSGDEDRRRHAAAERHR
ncbi:hypothetical protein [Phycicoccus sp. Soil748]|uniref:hypothetical protein n=1 Tax=Phycicoccus sp. Soil748 TaxID=1736397 RepID=UPI000702B3DA|nr:hypothetical protein [Phycicoccus sp. Soil748]KRE55353.1 hypothetical protein ASG70_08195 [Phycicoccus sp. Soil748]